MIRVEGVTKVFGPDPDRILPLLREGKTRREIQEETGHVVGVNNAQFSVAPNEIFAIMGLSGSGKSTLIRCINRLVEPTSGQIFITHADSVEREITSMGPDELRTVRRNEISMVFQHFALLPHRTVLSNVLYGLEIQGKGVKDQQAVAMNALELVGLNDWASAYPEELSGGMQQRVGIARALATDARILLMDEPFSALDPLIRIQMQGELRRLQRELGRTILFITHDLDEAMRIGDRIAIMEGGEIVQIGTPEQILVNPGSEYVAQFVQQADPTNVVTAGVIALPVAAMNADSGNASGDIRSYSRKDYPEIQFQIDGDGRPRKAVLADREIPFRELTAADLQEALSVRTRPGQDFVFLCRDRTVLRELLTARLLSSNPVLVTNEHGKAVGTVSEAELISGVLKTNPDVNGNM